MVLPDRIELSASPLPRGCSTTELRQHVGEGMAVRRDGGSFAIGSGSTQGQKAPITGFEVPRFRAYAMSKTEQAAQREQRLAAKLRENLKRRKGQTKARAQSEAQAPDPQPAPETDTVNKP